MRASLFPSVVACMVAAGAAGACRQAAVPGIANNATPAAIESSRSLAVGDVAPEFSLSGSDGKHHSLASYRGRQAVVLVWFSKAFTEG